MCVGGTVRVLLFTADEPLYLPSYVETILDAHADVTAGVVLADPRRSLRSQARRQYGMYGPRAGARMAARFLRSRLLSKLPPRLQPRLTGRYHGVRSVARAHDVPVRAVPDLRAPSLTRWVGEVDPDVVLSVMCGQRIPDEVLSTPAYALNVHGSLLPRYRGRATAFWALHGDEDETGVTAHLMTEELDAGPIVERRAFPIDPGDTVHDVTTSIVEHGGDLAVDLLDRIRAGETLETEPNPTTDEDYHTLPGSAARREFRRRGGEFL